MATPAGEFDLGVAPVASPTISMRMLDVGTDNSSNTATAEYVTIARSPLASLNAVSSNQTGSTLLQYVARSQWFLQVIYAGTVTAGVINVYMSGDGTNFDSSPIMTFTIPTQATNTMIYVAQAPALAARAVLTGYTGSGNVTATIGAS